MAICSPGGNLKIVASEPEVKFALDTLVEFGIPDHLVFVLRHCNTYPRDSSNYSAHFYCQATVIQVTWQEGLLLHSHKATSHWARDLRGCHWLRARRDLQTLMPFVPLLYIN